MIVMTSAVPNRIQKNTEAEIEWGMFNYPTVEDGKDKQTVANIGGRAFAISKDSNTRSRVEHAPSQPFLLGLTAGDENSVSAECAVCARLNAYGAVADKAG